MEEIKIEICPYCNSTDFTKGFQYAQGRMFPDLSGFRLGSPIEHTICKNCGSIVHSKVKKLERFK